MFSRRSVTVCLEGFYYLFVLAFIVVGATMRDINLLFVLAGIMLGPLLFNWRLAMVSVRRLDVERHLPAQTFAGRSFRVEIRGRNRRRGSGSWMVVVQDSIQAITDGGGRLTDGQRTDVRVILPFVAPQGSRKEAYRVTLPRRGRYQFGPLRVTGRFPLGMIRASTRLKRYERLVVYPRLGRLTPDWLRLVDLQRYGRHQMHHRQGPIDGDYYGLREWRPGDSKRWIHWRTTAKLGKLAVRQFEQQQNRDMVLVLDLWRPDEPTQEQRGRVELAVSFAATVVDELSRRGGSRLFVALAAQRGGCWSGVASSLYARKTMERLALVQAAENNRLAEVLSGVLASSPLNARVVVVSTRGAMLEHLAEGSAFAGRPRHKRALHRVVWLDVHDQRLASVFHSS